MNEEGARRSRERIGVVFDEVAARLSDGRRFLVGDRLTAADVSFCALAAILVLPSEYRATLPTRARLTPEVRAEVLGYREHPAGKYLLRVYAESEARA